jgi:regulator of protease activity HflC (stomatin/prohibitin superfamily)
MKKTILSVAVVIMTITLTSCNDYQRQQAQLDAESHGKEILLEAESSKKAKIEDAKADLESAKLNAEKSILLAQARIKQAEANGYATVINAQAELKRIEIMKNALGGTDNYMTFMKYQMMYSGKGNKYFVATEASLPVMLNK